MRVVGGSLRGRTLAGPKDDSIRPTSDRVRESIFNILEHGVPDFSLPRIRVIDLFSGTGALGIEALSRNAAFCLFVETAPKARAVIRNNIETFALTGISKIFRRDATDLGPVGTMAPFDLAFLDPPYGMGFGEAALAALRDGGWLSPGAVIVLEEQTESEIAVVDGFTRLDERVYGDSKIIFFRTSEAR